MALLRMPGLPQRPAKSETASEMSNLGLELLGRTAHLLSTGVASDMPAKQALRADLLRAICESQSWGYRLPT